VQATGRPWTCTIKLFTVVIINVFHSYFLPCLVFVRKSNLFLSRVAPLLVQVPTLALKY